MWIMRRVVMLAVMLISSLCIAEAQEMTKHIDLSCQGLKEVQSEIPAVVTLVAGDSGEIDVEYPAAVEGYVNIYVEGNILYLDRKDDTVTRAQLAPLADGNPVRVRVSSSHIDSVLNTSDMDLVVEDSKFANILTIVNTRTMSVLGEAIEALHEVEIYNTGTMTCRIKQYNTDYLELVNTGWLYVNGTTTACVVEQQSTGIENTTLKVACEKLDISSTGSGVIIYSGSADDVSVIATGDATIRTSELNVE